MSQDLLVDSVELAVFIEKAPAEKRVAGPHASGEAYEIARGQVVTAVLEVDQPDDAFVTTNQVAGHEVEMARDGW